MTSFNIGHDHMDNTGDGHDKGDARKHIPGDGGIPGKAFGAFGSFVSPIHGAPIHGMTTHHDVVVHVACGSRIKHNGHGLNFECQGCGDQVTDLSELAEHSA